MSDNQEYSNEMRGTLWMLDKSERKERGPVATGTITVSGVDLRIAMWPSTKVAKPGSKADGKVYMSLALEYKQGATKFLVPVAPKDVNAISGKASIVEDLVDAEISSASKNIIDKSDDENLPF